MSFCSNCGGQMAAGTAFCGLCGAMASQSGLPQVPNPTATPGPGQTPPPAPVQPQFQAPYGAPQQVVTPAPRARRGFLKTAAYVSVVLVGLLAVGGLALRIFVSIAGPSQYGGISLLAQLYRQTQPWGTREMTDRYRALYFVKCGDSYYYWAKKGPSARVIIEGHKLRTRVDHRAPPEHDRLNGLQDSVTVAWDLVGAIRTARAESGRRVSDWGQWRQIDFFENTGASVWLIKEHGEWRYHDQDSYNDLQLPPLTCADVGAQ